MTEPIPWQPNVRTKYSDERHQKIFEQEPATRIAAYCVYVLWECSTEFMVNNGMPTDADVLMWIEWMNGRLDVSSVEIQGALLDCTEYVKPSPSHVSAVESTQSSEG